ncbi:hypothetical protein PIB30_030448 [Stylosanthes scabra]|uniref:Uncharacterized protein n=1 Tax=Stylosanthes scabra TaxID=79078 RepID=A0ABU6SB97_9FABA|nr:hypothetical protein [Stylosanthes scabra]
MVRARGGSSDGGFWQSQIMRPRHQGSGRAITPRASYFHLDWSFTKWWVMASLWWRTFLKA